MLIYVDDIVIIRTNSQLIDQVVCDLNSKFALKILGNLHYFLGIEVTRIETCMKLS